MGCQQGYQLRSLNAPKQQHQGPRLFHCGTTVTLEGGTAVLALTCGFVPRPNLESQWRDDPVHVLRLGLEMQIRPASQSLKNIPSVL